MLLSSLYKYYQDRIRIPLGYAMAPISFVIVIDKDGVFQRIEDARNENGTAPKLLVPRHRKPSKGITPWLFWGTAEYLLGMGKSGMANRRHHAFVELCQSVAKECPESEVLQAVVRFYDKGGAKTALESECSKLLEKANNAGIAFKLAHEPKTAAEEPCLRLIAARMTTEKCSAEEYPCLVTGKIGRVPLVAPPVRVPGTQASVSLLTFRTKSCFDSYGRSQCENAPLSPEVMHGTAAAFNDIASHPRRSVQIGNVTYRFWLDSEKENARIEESFFDILSPIGMNEDSRMEEAYSTFKSVYTGRMPKLGDTPLCILGVCGNQGRLSVVYWRRCPLREIASNIIRLRDEMAIGSVKERRPNCGVKSIIYSLSSYGKIALPPYLKEQVPLCIFNGSAFPPIFATHLIQAMRRRACDQKAIGSALLGCAKAFIIRNTNNNAISAMLDPNNSQLPYLAGRIFSLVDYQQENAKGTRSARSRFLVGASQMPSRIMPQVLALGYQYEDTLEVGTCIRIGKIRAEIMELMDGRTYPNRFSPSEQLLFFLGYEQQRAALYAKKKKPSEEA